MSHVDPANMPQCHYALQLPDILDIVFENMAPVWNEADRATCASCAHVCKSFQQPATRALWSDLRDLWPLWMILHPVTHVWTKSAENGPYFARVSTSVRHIYLSPHSPQERLMLTLTLLSYSKKSPILTLSCGNASYGAQHA